MLDPIVSPLSIQAVASDVSMTSRRDAALQSLSQSNRPDDVSVLRGISAGQYFCLCGERRLQRGETSSGAFDPQLLGYPGTHRARGG